MMDNLTRLRKMIGMRGVLGVWRAVGRGCEVPYTFEAVVPPDHIPAETDPATFDALISASKFLVRFDEGTLIDGKSTRRISGLDVVFPPDLRELANLLHS
jgi:hypothetical protein